MLRVQELAAKGRNRIFLNLRYYYMGTNVYSFNHTAITYASGSVHVGRRSHGSTVRRLKVKRGEGPQGLPAPAAPVSVEVALTAMTGHE